MIDHSHVSINLYLHGQKKKKKEKQREKNQINKIRNENGQLTTDKTEIQRIIKDYYQQLYANKMDNMEKTDNFLEKYNFLKILLLIIASAY